MKKILNKIQNTIDKYKMILPADKILLGISGGLDSVMLFIVLHSLMKKYNFSFICAHLNYNLRGKESFEDQEFVKNLCKEFHIPCFIKELNIAELSKKKKIGIEEIAREERYNFFSKQAKKYKINKIATAHTQDDNIETILMHFLRGTGINGLQGIPIIRDNIIRPLLEISRKEILEFLKKNKIKFQIDSTNFKNIYFRNKIRNNLLPFLRKEYNSNIDHILLNTSSIIKEENKYLDKIIQQKYKKIIIKTSPTKIILNLNEFLKNDIFIQKRIIINCFKNLKFKGIYYQHLENIISFLKNKKTTSFINLPNEIIVKKQYENLIIEKEKRKKIVEYCFKINSLGTTIIPELKIKITTCIVPICQLKEIKLQSKNKQIIYLDYDKISLPFFIRNKHRGDKFIPLGMNNYQKISDFFINEKIPKNIRNQISFFCDNQGNIFWIIGYRTSEIGKITNKTKKMLKIETSFIIE